MSNGNKKPAPLTEETTKTGLLAHLRELERRLYSKKVVAEVKAESSEEQMAFAQSRLHLTATIAKLNAALMREIGDEMEAQAEELQAGIDELSTSLSKLEGASAWTGAINGLIGTLGQLVPLL